LKVCAVPACAELTTSTYCAKHHKEWKRKAERKRPSSAKRGYTAKWQRTRARYLRAHPACFNCGERATEVHHLDGLGPSGPLGHSPDNLKALCRPCHSRITADEQPGGWNA
jgi:5-methylcytosine-specific restriction enzyme A